MEKKQKRPTHDWAIDQEYWDKLSEGEKEWLRQFNEEYYKGRFPKSKKSIHPEYLRNECYNRNNAMQRDAMVGATPLTNPEALDEGALVLSTPVLLSVE